MKTPELQDAEQRMRLCVQTLELVSAARVGTSLRDRMYEAALLSLAGVTAAVVEARRHEMDARMQAQAVTR
jgi:hypothetical protein